MTILTASWDAMNANIEAGGVFFFITTVGAPVRYDAAFSRCAFDLVSGTSAQTISVDIGSSVAEAWVHCAWYSASLNSGSGTGALFTWRSAANANADQMRLLSTAQAGNIHRVKFQKSTNGGAAWSDIVSTPATFDLPSAALKRLDLHVKCHATTGIVELYVDEVLALSFTGSTTTQNNVFDRVLFHGFGISSGDHEYVSEIIIANSSTISHRLFTMFPNASGAQSDFGGTFAEIDDIATVDNTNFINSDTTGHISLFALNDIGAGFNRYTVVATLLQAAVAISADAAITDLQMAYRHSTTNFFTSSTGYTHDSALRVFRDLRTTNPVTTLGWSFTDVNALQIGVKAV